MSRFVCLSSENPNLSLETSKARLSGYEWLGQWLASTRAALPPPEKCVGGGSG